jgi:hypothetical protein
MGVLNRIIVRTPAAPLLWVGRATVSVSGFAPREISAASRYMEWCVPSGAYEVKLFDKQASHQVSCALGHGDAVDIQLLPTLRYQLALTAAVMLALALTALLLAGVLDILKIDAWMLGSLLLLLVAVSGWCWQTAQAGFCVKVTKPLN